MFSLRVCYDTLGSRIYSYSLGSPKNSD